MMTSQIFDVFGRSIEDYNERDFFTTTDTDIERRLRLAETKLGNEGVGKEYVRWCYGEDEVLNLNIHVILLAADSSCMDDLNDYAK